MVVLFLNHIFVAQNGILMCGAGVLLKIITLTVMILQRSVGGSKAAGRLVKTIY